MVGAIHLFEWAEIPLASVAHSMTAICRQNLLGVGSPPGEEKGETDSLKDTGNSSDGNGVDWSLLSEDLSNELFGLLATGQTQVSRDITYRWSR